MRQKRLGVFALGDVAVDDDQPFNLAMVAGDGARGGFEHAPGPVLVANAVFQTVAVTGAIRLLCRFRDPGAIIRMYLFKGGRGSQLLGGVAKHLLICRTVIKTLALSVYNRNHVGCIFCNKVEETLSF